MERKKEIRRERGEGREKGKEGGILENVFFFLR